MFTIYFTFCRYICPSDESKHGHPSSITMVVDSIMLDKTSEKEGQTGRFHIPHKCSDCGCTFNPQPEPPLANSQPSALTRNRRSHKAEKPSKCPSCEARLDGYSGRGQHRRFRPDPHSCPLCTKTFISSAHLALHQASHTHSKDKKYKCGICGKLFHQSAHLVIHKMIHSGERPFKCPECGKTFGRASHLKTHRRLHTGEKPFKCTFCDKAFAQKAGLLSHVRKHTEEQPFKCEHCGKAFRSSALLLSHKAQESAEHRSASVLNLQQKPHTGQEDLKCGVCCRTFVRSSYVRLYMRLNRGQRPYHCKVCNKTFVKMDTFVNHCDKHLRQKRVKNGEVEEKVVKPPLFVPLSSPSAPLPTSTLPALSEVTTRSRARAKTKVQA